MYQAQLTVSTLWDSDVYYLTIPAYEVMYDLTVSPTTYGCFDQSILYGISITGGNTFYPAWVITLVHSKLHCHFLLFQILTAIQPDNHFHQKSSVEYGQPTLMLNVSKYIAHAPTERVYALLIVEHPNTGRIHTLEPVCIVFISFAHLLL